jgi:hypothetical protein
LSVCLCVLANRNIQAAWDKRPEAADGNQVAFDFRKRVNFWIGHKDTSPSRVCKCDEMWSYCFKKEGNKLPAEKDDDSNADAYR